jgi:hypothetical protein
VTSQWTHMQAEVLAFLRPGAQRNSADFRGMNEEEFKKYLQTFVQDIWLLLTRVSLEPRQVLTAEQCCVTEVMQLPVCMRCCAA